MSSVEGLLNRIDTGNNEQSESKYDRKEIHMFLQVPQHRQEFTQLLNKSENRQRLQHALDKGFDQLLKKVITDPQPLAMDETVCHAFQLYLMLHGNEYNYSPEAVEDRLRTLKYFQEVHPNVTSLLLTQPIKDQLDISRSFRTTYNRLLFGYPQELAKLDKQLVQTYRDVVPVQTSKRVGQLLIDEFNSTGHNPTERYADQQFQYLYMRGHERLLVKNTTESLLSGIQLGSHAMNYQQALRDLQAALSQEDKTHTNEYFLATMSAGKKMIENTQTTSELNQRIKHHQLGIVMSLKTYIEDSFGRKKNKSTTPQYAQLLLQIAGLLDKETLRTMKDMFSDGHAQAEQIISDIQTLRRELSQKNENEYKTDICVLDMFLKGVKTQKETLQTIQKEYSTELTVLPYILFSQQRSQDDKLTFSIDQPDGLQLPGGPLYDRAIEAKQRAKESRDIERIDYELQHIRNITFPHGASLTGILTPEDQQTLLTKQEMLGDNQQLVYVGHTGLSVSQIRASSLGLPYIDLNCFRILTQPTPDTGRSLTSPDGTNAEELDTATLQNLSLLQGGLQEHLKSQPLMRSAVTVSTGLKTLTTPLHEVLTTFSAGEQLTPELVQSVRSTALQLLTVHDRLQPHIGDIHKLCQDQEQLSYLRLVLGDQAQALIENIQYLDSILFSKSGISQFEMLLKQLTNPRTFNENTRDTRLQNNALKILGGVAGAVILITFSVGTLGLGTPLAIGAAGALGGMIGSRLGQALNEGVQDNRLAAAADPSGSHRLVYDDPTDIEILLNNPSKEQSIQILMNMSTEFFLGMMTTYGFIKVGQRVGSMLPHIPNESLRKGLIRATRLDQKTRPPLPLDVEINFMKKFIANFREELPEELFGIGLEKATEELGFLSFLGDLANVYFCIQPGGNKNVSLRSYERDTKTALLEYDADDTNFFSETRQLYQDNPNFQPLDINEATGTMSFSYTDNGETYTLHYQRSQEMINIRANPEVGEILEEHGFTFDPETNEYRTTEELSVDQRVDLIDHLKRAKLLVITNESGFDIKVFNENADTEHFRTGIIMDGQNQVTITANKEASETTKRKDFIENLKNNTLLREAESPENGISHVIIFANGYSLAPGGIGFSVNETTRTITLSDQISFLNVTDKGPYSVQTNTAALLRSLAEKFPGYEIDRRQFSSDITMLKSKLGIDLNTYGDRMVGTIPASAQEQTEVRIPSGQVEIDPEIESTYSPEAIFELIDLDIREEAYQGADITIRKIEDGNNPHVVLIIEKRDGQKEIINVTERILQDAEFLDNLPPGQNLGQLLGLAGISPFNLRALAEITDFMCEESFDELDGKTLQVYIKSPHFRISIELYPDQTRDGTTRGKIKIDRVEIHETGRSLFSGLDFIETLTHYAISNQYGYIDLYAAKRGGIMNGYYTWPRYGFQEVDSRKEAIRLHILEYINDPYTVFPVSLRQELKKLSEKHLPGSSGSIMHDIMSDSNLMEFRRLYGISFEAEMILPTEAKPDQHPTYQKLQDYKKERQLAAQRPDVVQDPTSPPQITNLETFIFKQRGKAELRHDHLSQISKVQIQSRLEKETGLKEGSFLFGLTGSDGRGENRYDASKVEIIFYSKNVLTEDQKSNIASIINEELGDVVSESAQDGPIDIEFRDNPNLSLLHYTKDGSQKGFYPTRIFDIYFLNEKPPISSKEAKRETEQYIESLYYKTYTELQTQETQEKISGPWKNSYNTAKTICNKGTQSRGLETIRHFNVQDGKIYYNYDPDTGQQRGIKYGPIRLIQYGIMDCVHKMVNKGLEYESYKQLLGTDTIKRCDMMISSLSKAKASQIDALQQDRSLTDEQIKSRVYSITHTYDAMLTNLQTIKEGYAYFLQIHLGMQSQFQKAGKPKGGIDRDITQFGSTVQQFNQHLVSLKDAIGKLRERLNNPNIVINQII